MHYHKSLESKRYKAYHEMIYDVRIQDAKKRAGIAGLASIASLTCSYGVFVFEPAITLLIAFFLISYICCFVYLALMLNRLDRLKREKRLFMKYH